MKIVAKDRKKQMILEEYGVSFAIVNGHGCVDTQICHAQNVSQI